MPGFGIHINAEYSHLCELGSESVADIDSYLIPTVFCGRTMSNPTQVSVSVANLRFTQDSIKDSFGDPYGDVKLTDTVTKIRNGRLHPNRWGPLEVHRGNGNFFWCENNRRLWVMKKAGVSEVLVTIKSDDNKSRRLDRKTRETLSDPNFLPRVRGGGVHQTGPSTLF